jgi:hypothetical protein
MCGIAGWISYNRDLTAHQDIIAAMMKTMARRGPDAGGVWIESNAASEPVFVSPSRHHRAQRRSRPGVGSRSICWKHCARSAYWDGTRSGVAPLFRRGLSKGRVILSCG